MEPRAHTCQVSSEPLSHTIPNVPEIFIFLLRYKEEKQEPGMVVGIQEAGSGSRARSSGSERKAILDYMSSGLKAKDRRPQEKWHRSWAIGF